MQLYGTPGWGSAIVEAMLALVGEPYEFVDVENFDRRATRRRGSSQSIRYAVSPPWC